MPRGRPRHPDLLTPREWQVLGLLRQGLTNAEIGVRLHVSPDTVKTHVAQVLAKLDVHTRQEAAEWAERNEQARAGWPGLVTGLFRTARDTLGAKAVAAGAVIVVAIVATLALLASPSAPTTNGAMGKLAYIQDGNVWVKDMPDGKPRQLTSDGNAWSPRWSRSGEWLSEGFVVGTQNIGGPAYGVTVFRADGSDKRYAPACYDWSPTEDVLLCNGATKFFTETPDGRRHSEFDVVQAIRQVRDTPVVGARCHVWSPDGRRVACNVFGTIVQGESGPSQYAGLWTFQLDGTDPRELVARDRFAENGGGVIAMWWDRDSDTIAFMLTPPSSQICETFDCAAPGVRVYEVSALGDSPPRLLGEMSSWELLPGNTPEGWLLTDGVGAETWTNKRIARVDGQGVISYLTDSDYASGSPALSPDLSKIAYVSAIDAGSIVAANDGSAGRDSAAAKQAKGERRIWLMNADGSGKRQLTTDVLYRDERPQWSPDGSHIVFMRLTAEGQASVWLISAGGGSPEKVAEVSKPSPASALPNPNTRDDYFARWFDYFGNVPQWLLYSWWQPR
jgi:DNA-binding CsgD family transcriptional regulator/Tol biopolymer transport system component